MGWVLFAEVGLLIFGLIGLISGKLSLGKNYVVRGPSARWLGAVAMLPLPVSVGVGLIVGMVLVARGGIMGPGDLAIDNTTKIILGAIELGITLACLIAVYAIGIPIAKRQAELEDKLDQDDDDDDDYEDRRSRRRRRQPAPRTPPPLPAAPAMLRFPCTGCGALIQIHADSAGRKVRCPKCQAIQQAPAAPPPDAITTRPRREREL